MITLGQLIVPLSQDEAYDTLVAYLAGQGYQATSWQTGSIQKGLLKGFAWLYSAASNVISDLAGAGYPSLAKGLYQDALGEFFYDLPRVQATAVQGTMTLKLSAAASPAAWGTSELVVADAPTAPANSFRIVSAGSLAPGALAQFAFVGETPGAAANIPPNVPLYFWTPITGLSATNPPLLGSSTWITAEGQDQESSDRFATRMTGRWSRLSYGNTEGAYKAWAFEALPALTRCTVFEGPNDGEVVVVGATATGGLTDPQIATIADYINGVTDGKGRRPINDVLIVQSSTEVSAPSLGLTIYVDSQYATGVAGKVNTALVNLFGSLPLGGERISPSTIGYVYKSTVYSAIMAIQGIRNVTGIPDDIVLSPTDIYVPAIGVVVVVT